VTRPASTVAQALPHELERGTGRVQGVIVRAGETLLRLGYPHGRDVVVAVSAVPLEVAETEPSMEGIRPVAVRITNSRAGFACSVLATSATGPRRVRISIAQALGLCASGVHTVLCTE